MFELRDVFIMGKRGIAVLAVMLPGLMGTSAVLAQDAGGGVYSAGATVGGQVQSLPTFTPSIVLGSGAGADIDNSIDPMVYGGILAGSFSAVVGPVADHVGIINLSGFVSVSNGGGSSSTTLDGMGAFALPGMTIPVDSQAMVSTLTATPGALSSTSEVVITPGTLAVGQSFLATGPGPAGVWGTVSDAPNDAFSLMGGAINPDYALAFAAIASPAGGGFVAEGDLTGIEITSDSAFGVVSAGGDITFALAGSASSGMGYQVYGGPSVRFMNQSILTGVSIDIPEPDPSDTGFAFATYTQSTDEMLVSHYYGGVAGIGASTQLGNGVTVSVLGEGGVYWSQTEYTGTESYSVSSGLGGNTDAGDLSVDNSATASDSASGMAYSARGQATVTVPVADALQLNFGAGAEFLSSVATVSRVDNSNPMISFGSSWAFNGTVSVTGQF